MTTQRSMKAIQIHEYGGRQTLRHEQIAIPEITGDEVLIQVLNTSVNPVDWKVRDGLLADAGVHQLPLTLGWDVAGRIAIVGSDVTGLNIGDEVYALGDIGRDGAYAEYIAVDAKAVARKPQTLTFSQAAAVPLTALTAWQAVKGLSAINKNDSVLIHGASGGVGSFAVQFAKLTGARVTAIASAANHDYLLSLGADVVVDYNTPEYLGSLGQFDVVFDIVDNDAAGIYDKVKEEGKYITTLKQHEIPSHYSFDHQRVFVVPSGEQLTGIGLLIDRGEIQLPEITEMSFEQIQQAHALSEAEHVRGKIVINI